MKKNLFMLLAFAIATFSLSAQNLDVYYGKVPAIEKNFQKKYLKAGKAMETDTSFFYLARLSDEDSAKLIGIHTSSAVAAGQYFSCPQPMAVNGVWFMAASYPQPTVACTVAVYNADVQGLPTGVPLGSTIITVDSAFNNGIDQYAAFTTPVNVTQPYVIVISNATASGLYLITTNYITNDGLGDDYACALLGTTWLKASSLVIGGIAYDADFLFAPSVTYNLADPTYTFTPGCLNAMNQTVSFSLNEPAIYGDEMYNWWAYVDADSVQNQFFWSYGDGDFEMGMDVSHDYATPALYDITLYYYFEGWTYYTDIDSVMDNIDVCTGVEENQAEKVVLYPSPATDYIVIDHADGARFDLYNVMGELLQSVEISASKYVMSLRSLPCGTYFGRFEINGSYSMKKFSIIR